MNNREYVAAASNPGYTDDWSGETAATSPQNCGYTVLLWYCAITRVATYFRRSGALPPPLTSHVICIYLLMFCHPTPLLPHYWVCPPPDRRRHRRLGHFGRFGHFCPPPDCKCPPAAPGGVEKGC
eukprot:1188748-Prorocentrum_minimum.AAC.4